MLRIAIQNKGRLREQSIKFLKALGLKWSNNSNKLLNKCLNADVEIISVRNSDIPIYVEQGVTDLGIVGENVLIEGNYKIPIIQKLGFCRCSLVIAAPKSSKRLFGERIATSYPTILKKYLQKNKISASIIKINGSVEIAPSINLADAICDIAQTGKTLKENKLQILDKIMDSQAVLIAGNNKLSKNVRNLLTKIL
ncbi:ATP phosphoribosyltransferase [Patescibacteria group bacterium]